MIRASRRVGRYRLYGEIASGGAAAVHFGRLQGHEGFARAVAIKRLHARPAKDPGQVSLFVGEARLAARVRHPNVVPTLDLVEEGGDVHVVMEYVHGVSLAELLAALARTEATMPLAIASSIVSGLLHGLHAAHQATDERGVPLALVHRDVSPGNVLVGVDGVARVTDFGVATARGRVDGTDAPDIRGKLGYVAPEQLDGAAVDRTADVYATGAVLWEALTGAQLVTGSSTAAMLVKALRGAARPPSSVRPEIEPELDAVCVRALALEPGSRFADARAMALALEAACPPAPAREVGALVETAMHDEIARRAALLAAVDADPTDERDDGLASTRADPARPVRRTRALATAAVATALLAGGVAAWRSRGPGDAAGPAATATSSPPPPTAVAITELPPPASKNAEALAAFRDAMQALRDGASSAAVVDLQRAVDKDPDLAAAHLRLARFLFYARPEDARAHFLRAVSLREKLSPRDQALLDALEPHILRQPGDEDEHARRIAAAAARYPEDAELAFYAALVKTRASEGTEQLVALERPIALDPKFTLARAAAAERRAYLGDFEGSRREIAACLRGSPTASHCALLRAELTAAEGECERFEAEARGLVAIDPESSHGYRLLAAALFARGSPEASVREALDQAHKRFEPMKLDERIEDEIALDALRGDFERAVARGDELEHAVEESRVRAAHAEVARIRIDLLLEIGDTAGAGAIAKRYLDRKDGWVGDTRREDFAIARDPTPYMLAVAARGKAVPAADADAQRDAWVAAWQKEVLPAWRSFVWPHGFAAAATTAAEARAAVAALREGQTPPPFAPHTSLAADIGRTLFLAGREGDALPWLERAARDCDVFDQPVATTRANLWLGAVREATGDREGACAAYAVVARRWGHAKPRSVTARDAERRARALACPPP